MAVYIPKNGLDFTLRKKRTYRSVCRNYKPLDFASWKQAESFARWDIFLRDWTVLTRGGSRIFSKREGVYNQSIGTCVWKNNLLLFLWWKSDRHEESHKFENFPKGRIPMDLPLLTSSRWQIFRVVSWPGGKFCSPREREGRKFHILESRLRVSLFLVKALSKARDEFIKHLTVIRSWKYGITEHRAKN